MEINTVGAKSKKGIQAYGVVASIGVNFPPM